MGRNSNSRNKLKQLLKDVVEEYCVLVLQIHAIRLLSQGIVMTRSLQCMLALLDLFRVEEPHWYEIVCSFKLHFT